MASQQRLLLASLLTVLTGTVLGCGGNRKAHDPAQAKGEAAPSTKTVGRDKTQVVAIPVPKPPALKVDVKVASTPAEEVNTSSKVAAQIKTAARLAELKGKLKAAQDEARQATQQAEQAREEAARAPERATQAAQKAEAARRVYEAARLAYDRLPQGGTSQADQRARVEAFRDFTRADLQSAQADQEAKALAVRVRDAEGNARQAEAKARQAHILVDETLAALSKAFPSQQEVAVLEQVLQEQAAQERTAREQAAREQLAREQAAQAEAEADAEKMMVREGLTEDDKRYVRGHVNYGWIHPPASKVNRLSLNVSKPFRDGDIGVPYYPAGGRSSSKVAVDRIINGDEMVVWGGKLWIKGVSTAGLSDGSTLELKGVFFVDGTKDYTTSFGVNVPLPCLVAIDVKKVELALDSAEVQNWVRAKPAAKPITPATAPDDSPFVGRWKLVNDKGVVSSYLTVTKSFGATRDHVPDAPGRWEVIGNEARFTWADGFRDILRLEKGGVTFLSLGRETTSWDSNPLFQLRAERVP